MTILIGDCVEQMQKMPDDSVDAVVTDPPYGLEFMGKDWDSFGKDTSHAYREKPRITDRADREGSLSAYVGASGKGINHFQAGPPFQRWCETWACEALRVLKPGGHLLAFGGTRTYHRLACAIEDAGFEIRDSLAWLYGSGFPKSRDIAKDLDRANGIEREDKFEGSFERRAGPTGNRRCEVCGKWLVSGSPCQCPRPQDAAVSEDARRWEGWGTALKPAHETIVVARKPLAGTVAANVLEHGTGAINIDACRIEASADLIEQTGEVETLSSEAIHQGYDRPGRTMYRTDKPKERAGPANVLGRWPANVVLSHTEDCVLVGTRRVTARTINRWDDGAKPFGGGAGHPYTSDTLGDDDGLEEVEQWECAPDCPVRMLDEQSGNRPAGGKVRGTEPSHTGETGIYGVWSRVENAPYEDAGGASRFFYCAKASRAERNAGLVRCDCETFTSWVNEDQPASTPADSVTQHQRGITEPISTDDSNSFTSGSGSESMAQSPKGTRSTTETATSRTTKSPISNSLTTSLTSDSTVPTFGEPEMVGNDAAISAEPGNQQTQSIGTSTSEAGFSTDDVVPVTSELSSPQNSASVWCPECGGLRGGHPTVKPVALMRWLVRLVTPPDGTVLDPFSGSGTTGIACTLEGFNFIGIERDEEYANIAQTRIAYWTEHGEHALQVVAERERSEQKRQELADAGQMDLFGALS